MARTSKIRVCDHGLNDRVRLSARSVVEDFDTGVKTTIYRYWCEDHQAYGTHSIVGRVEPKPEN